MTSTSRPLVSIIIPMLNEADNVQALAERMRQIQKENPGHRFEFVVVDDGSTDDSGRLLQAQAGPALSLTLIELSRNFGSHYAISAGLQEASGECGIILGADLQEPPDLIGRFLDQWANGFEVVWGIRRTRAGRGVGTLVSRVFSRLFSRYSEIKTYPAEGPSGVLCDRLVIDAVNQLGERNRNTLGLIAWVGFRQTRVEYDQLPRNSGESKWNRRKLLRLAFDSFVEFSSAPIKLGGLLGIAIAGIGFLYALLLVVRAFLGAGAPEGWTTVVVVVLILGGLQLLVLSVFGEYLWRIADDARNRPVYVTRHTSKSTDEPK